MKMVLVMFPGMRLIPSLILPILISSCFSDQKQITDNIATIRSRIDLNQQKHKFWIFWVKDIIPKFQFPPQSLI
ncbi:hypothetical protein Anacy_3270 [Anabaena cylindrica PCC 7122]|uniref:Lipoprotein n=1 Tax=Anabaena cylindrica (strain ATCC 27899 / PCC 7122) TaxID=272123 RepID=K9ZHK5_ANACC|nr:hypothetical protein Anacy_3270 [Anabaena cylindrica PCC 7122]BAY04314.1 hypothetical protein NIES19_35770 [Anabaena cylindrica PCC 7122]